MDGYKSQENCHGKSTPVALLTRASPTYHRWATHNDPAQQTTEKTNPRHLVKVTFRAVPQLYGQPRYDNVKVKLGDTNNVMHMYFARYCNSATKMLPQMFSKMYFIITFHGTFFNFTCATGASLFSKTTMATISHYYGGTQK